MTTKSIIGITVAICGNVLISLALNFQKLAHKRLDMEKARERELQIRKNSTVDMAVEERAPQETARSQPSMQDHSSANVIVAETVPLLQHHTESFPTGYGSSSNVLAQPSNRKSDSRRYPIPVGRDNVSNLADVREDSESSDTTYKLSSVDGLVDSPLEYSDRLQNGKSTTGEGDDTMDEDWNESDYLKSKLWYATHPFFRYYPSVPQLDFSFFLSGG